MGNSPEIIHFETWAWSYTWKLSIQDYGLQLSMETSF